jgi:hypothetical protein
MTVNSPEEKKILGSAQRFRIALGVVAKFISFSLALAYQDGDWSYLANVVFEFYFKHERLTSKTVDDSKRDII